MSRLSGVRTRARAAVMRRIFFWLHGPGMVGPGDPSQQYTVAGPSWPTFKSIVVDPTTIEPVRIGRYSGMHYTVTIAQDGEHHTDWVGLAGGYVLDGKVVRVDDATFSQGPVIIGNDVWVGFEALILSGVTIGDGAAVGAGTVVRRSVEPFEIVGGNPARHLGFRFEEPIRDALLRIRWWDWTDDKVALHTGQIHSTDVEGFVKGHDPALGPPSCVLCR